MAWSLRLRLRCLVREALGTQATASMTKDLPRRTLCLGVSIVTNSERRDLVISSLVGLSA